MNKECFAHFSYFLLPVNLLMAAEKKNESIQLLQGPVPTTCNFQSGIFSGMLLLAAVNVVGAHQVPACKL